VIVDYKSGKGKPKAPRSEPDAELATGKQYLSERGHFQLDSYGLLGLRKYPQAKRAILRELHLRSGKTREAVLGREELEHVERQIGLHLMLLDEARALFMAGESETHALLRPRPGSWCARKCPVAASCPVPAEQRGVGALDSDEAADAAAGRYVNVDGLRNTLREQLRTYHEQTGRAPLVGDGTAVFWRPKPDGKGRSTSACSPSRTSRRRRPSRTSRRCLRSRWLRRGRGAMRDVLIAVCMTIGGVAMALPKRAKRRK
jgi:hypothetical protein